MKKTLLLIAQRLVIIAGACFLVYSLYAPVRQTVVDFPMLNKHMSIGGVSDGADVYLPFIVEMKTSKIIHDNPTIGVFKKGSWTLAPGSEQQLEVESGGEYSLIDWDIIVDTVYSSAIQYKDFYVQKEVRDGVPAAFVRVTDKRDGTFRSGWIYTGSLEFPPHNLDLGDSLALVLQTAKPLTYQSEIVIMRERTQEEITPEMSLDYIPLLRLDSFLLKEGESHPLPDGWRLEMIGYEGLYHNHPEKVMMRATQGAKTDWKRYAGVALLLLGAVWLLADRRKEVKK